MSENQKLTLLKFVAVSTAAYYLFHLSKSRGQSMSGRMNVAKIANLGAHLFPEEFRPHVRTVGTAVINRMLEHE